MGQVCFGSTYLFQEEIKVDYSESNNAERLGVGGNAAKEIK